MPRPRLPKPPNIKLPKPPTPPRSLSAFFWAILLGVYIFFFGISTGFARDSMIVVSVIAGCLVMVTVTLYGAHDDNR